jgi:hypothetical protein
MTLPQAFAVVLRWLRAVWEPIEPLLALSTVQGRISAVLLFAVTALVVWKRRAESQQLGRGAAPHVLGPNPSLRTVCEHLAGLISTHQRILGNAQTKQREADGIVENLANDVLRVYFFGHQNAGKSSLVNALLGADVSPASPGKLTACLLRIRRGSSPRMLERWSDGSERERPLAELRKRMERWAVSDERPREVIAEIARDVLGDAKTEFVDTPGTGSAWSDEHGRSIEDEVVNAAVRAAAVVVVVYRHSAGEIEAHDNLLRQFGGNDVPVLAVCNLDPNWAGELIQNKRSIDATIDRIEARMRALARAKCYQVAIQADTNLQKLARRAGADDIASLRTGLSKLLEDRKALGIFQAVRAGKALIEEMLLDVQKNIHRLQPLFDSTERGRLELLDAVANVRSVLNRGYDRGYKATFVGAAVGGAMATWGAVSAAVAMTAATAGVALGFVVVGGAVGFLADQRGRWRFRKQLAAAWTLLQRALTATNLIDRSLAKKVLAASRGVSERQCADLVNQVEMDLVASLEKLEGYDTYRKSKLLEVQLHELWSLIHTFAGAA